MTFVTLPRTRPAPTLDFGLLRRGFLYFAGVATIVAPFTPEPLAMAVGSIVPWILLRIIGTPNMPAAVAYIFLWQWMQIFTRVIQCWIDGETLGGGIDGPNVARAYWYMLSGVIALAIGFRAVLSNLRPPTQAQRTAHFRWQTNDMLMLYAGGAVIAVVMGVAARVAPGLSQPLGAAAQIKVVAMFVLFVTVMSTGRGTKPLLAVVLFEIFLGFTGFFSDFRSVFIYLFIAALSAHVRWKGTTTVAALGGAAGLIFLALFWTAVKVDYRVYVAKSDEAQEINVPLSERMAYLGQKVLSFGDINFQATSYQLVNRLAYVDIFGSVIDVQEASPEPIPMRQWQEGLEHVLTPRFLFPNKAALSDSEVYMRLAKRFTMEGEVRLGTSISVGYMAENFADLGFPGMLAGITVLGMLMAGVVRLMLTYPLPQVMRDGIIMGYAMGVSRDGVEVSMPKILGAMFMFLVVFMIVNRFFLPRVVQWLDQRSAPAGLKAI